MYIARKCVALLLTLLLPEHFVCLQMLEGSTGFNPLAQVSSAPKMSHGPCCLLRSRVTTRVIPLIIPALKSRWDTPTATLCCLISASGTSWGRRTIANGIRRHTPEWVRGLPVLKRKITVSRPATLRPSHTPTHSSCQPPERQWSFSSPLIMNSLSLTGELPSASALSGLHLKVNPLPPPPPQRV